MTLEESLRDQALRQRREAIERAERAERALAGERERIESRVLAIVVNGGDESYWEGVLEFQAAVLAILQEDQRAH